VRAQDVADKKFQPTVFRNGYSQDDVDDLLDRVQATFAAAEQGGRPVTGRLAGARTVTPEDVASSRFRRTRMKSGYDCDEVDDFLVEVVVALRALAR